MLIILALKVLLGSLGSGTGAGLAAYTVLNCPVLWPLPSCPRVLYPQVYTLPSASMAMRKLYLALTWTAFSPLSEPPGSLARAGVSLSVL